MLYEVITENKHTAQRWLLQELEQTIGGIDVHAFGGANNRDLALGAVRTCGNKLTQRPYP